MAGKGHPPAAPHEDPGARDGVETAVREPWSRARVLHLLLVTTLILCVPATVGTVVEARGAQADLPVTLFVSQALFAGLLVVLVLVNRRGRTLLASWVFCGLLVLNGSEFFALPELDRTLVVYAAPILVAGFLIRPVAAFQVLALSAADYLVAYLRHAGDHPFNWLSLLVLTGLAAASWLAARRAAWFEEGEEMFRVELDRVAADRDELEARVASLRAQLEALRAPASARSNAGRRPEAEYAGPRVRRSLQLMDAEKPGAEE